MQGFRRVRSYVAAASTSVMLGLSPLPGLADEAEDRGYLEGLLEDALSDGNHQVDIVGFTGALSSRAQIEALRISDADGVWLTVEGLQLDWDRSALFSGRVVVEEFSAERIEMPRRPLPDPNALPNTAARGFSLPELPVSVELGKLAIGEARFGADVFGQPAALTLDGSANLVDGEGTANLAITRLDQPEAALRFAASYSNASRNLALDLTLQEPAGGILSNQLNIPGSPALQLVLQGEGQIEDFTAELALEADGQPRLSGRLTLLAGQDADTQDNPPLLFRADLGGNIAPLFAPDYQDFFGDNISLQFEGRRAGSLLSISQLELQSAALSLQGALDFEDGWARALDLRGQLASDSGEAVLLPLSGPKTRVQRANFTLRHDSTKSEVWAFTAEVAQFDRTELRIENLRLNGTGQARKGGLTGKLDLATLGLDFADPALNRAIGPQVTGGLSFLYLTDSPLQLTEIDLQAGDLGIRGEVALAGLADGLQLQVSPDLSLQARDLSRFSDLASMPLSGQAQLDLRGTIEPLSGAMDVSLQGRTSELALLIPRLDPYLKGEGTLSLQLARDEDGTRVNPLKVNTKDAEIVLTADLRPSDSLLEASATLRDLTPLLPGASGEAKLEFNAVQSGTNSWQTRTLFTGPGNSQIDANILMNDILSDTLTLQGTARVKADSLRPYSGLAQRRLSGAVDLTVTGRATPKAESFDLQLALQGQDLAADLGLADRLTAGRSDLRLDLARDKAGQLHLRSLSLDTAELTATVSGRGTLDTNALTYRARLRDIAVLGAGLNGPVTATGTADLRQGRYQIDSQLTGPAGSRLTVAGDLRDDFSRANLSLRGQAPLSLANPLIQPRSLDGLAQLDLRLNGPLQLSALSGRVSTAGSRLSLPNLRQSLQGITGSANLSGGQAGLDLTAQLAGGGQISLTGPVQLEGAQNANLQLQVRNAVLRDPRLYRTTVDGDLTVTGRLQGGARVSGQLRLGDTEVRIPSTGAPRFANLPQLQHRHIPPAVQRTLSFAGLIEGEGSAAASGPAYGLDLTILAPSRIFVRGRGLDAELGGQLRLTGDSQNVVPIGQFDLIRGRLDILGKRLDLTEGRIRLQGAFDPFVRFVAETTVDTEAVSTVQIILEGALSSPNLTLTSTPQLPEDEILSLLLFGRDITSISPLQAVRLAAAVRTLAGYGGQGLTGRLRKGLGLDDLDVATTEEGTTEARFGKYINDNVYTEITADTEGQTRIDLNLNISRHLTARGRLSSDGETSIGLFFEKDY